jgi:hypothetical protein
MTFHSPPCSVYLYTVCTVSLVADSNKTVPRDKQMNVADAIHFTAAVLASLGYATHSVVLFRYDCVYSLIPLLVSLLAFGYTDKHEKLWG